jgi:hypothetical protein
LIENLNSETQSTTFYTKMEAQAKALRLQALNRYTQELRRASEAGQPVPAKPEIPNLTGKDFCVEHMRRDAVWRTLDEVMTASQGTEF